MDHEQHGESRRDTMAVLVAMVTGAIGMLVPLGAGLVTLLDPLLRRRSKPLSSAQSNAGSDFVRLASLDAIPADGVPRRVTVLVDQVDAWNFTPSYPAGAVYVRRLSGDDTVQVLHATCPHAGCSVAPSDDGEAFHCPCHNSAFALDGTRVSKAGKENPSPRNMDELEVDTERLRQGELWVRYQDFLTGIEERKAKL